MLLYKYRILGFYKSKVNTRWLFESGNYYKYVSYCYNTILYYILYYILDYILYT